MKKIINNKVYDTATAKAVAWWDNGQFPGDLGYIEETLYRKKTGEHFLHGEGGPGTKYARTTGQNSWAGGELLIPLDYAAAQQWAEEHLSSKEYEALFGEVAEDNSRKVITISLSVTAAETLKRKASEIGLSQSAYIESLIRG